MFKTLCLLLCVLCVSAVIAADDAVIVRLRQHGDYPAIERYCREKLRTPGLTLDSRVEYVAELAGSLAQQANTAADAEQAGKQWAESDRLLAEFIDQNPKHSRVPFLLRQRTIYGFAEGESLRRAAELSQDPVALALSRKRLEQAAEFATQLDQIVRQALDAYNAKASRLEFKELIALSNDVPYRLGQIHLSIARAHRPDSEEQKRSLDEAAKRFEFYTREGYSDDEVVVRSHLALGATLRLARDFKGSAKALAPVEQSKSTPQPLRDEALAIRVHGLLDQKQPQAALALFEGRAKLSADLALARIRAWMVQAQESSKRGERAAAGRSQDLALRAAITGEKAYGSAWLAAADRILAAHGSSDWLEADAGCAIRLGEAFERRHDTSGAVAAFTKASELLRTEGKAEADFDAGLRAVKLRFRHADKGSQTVEPLRRLLRDAPTAEKAAEAGLWLVHALQAQCSQTTLDKDGQQLREHLREHLRRFPTHPTTAGVRLLAGRHAAARQEHREAIDHFAAVPAAHERFQEALDGLVDSYMAMRVMSTGEESRRLTLAGLALVDRCTKEVSPGAAGNAKRSTLQLARSQLLVRPDASPAELEQARRLLEELGQAKDLPTGQRRRVLRTQFLASVVAADFVHAERLAPQLDADELDRCRKDLKAWLEQTPNPKTLDLVRGDLLLLERMLFTSKGPPVEVPQLKAERVRLLARLGKLDEARQQIAALRRDHSRDAGLAEQLAGVLMALGTERDFTHAAELWQALGVTHKEGTEKWLEAKYQLAVCYGKLGQKERALKVLRLTSDLWLNDADVAIDDVRKRFRGQFKALETQLSK